MRSRLSTRLLLAGALALSVLPSARAEGPADVKLNALFTDHAVLQRGREIPVWGTAGPDESITVTFNGATAKATADAKGAWIAKLPAQTAGGPYELKATGKTTATVKDVLVGEVWVCSGQSNMEWTMVKSYEPKKDIESAKNPMIRLFTVPKATSLEPTKTLKAEWKECAPASVSDFSAVGYYFGRDLQKALNVPVGLIHTSWGGTPAEAWTSKEALAADPSTKHYAESFAKLQDPAELAKAKEKYQEALKKYEDATAKYKEAVATAKKEGKPAPVDPKLRRPNEPTKNQNSPTVLYNAMIAPLLPYSVQGAIWYQGESNAGRAYEYRTLFPTMIEDWRAKWNRPDMTFLAVQLAPYSNGNSAATQYAELREAQLLATTKLRNVGMAVITDVGEEKDIHPKKKEPAGARLALLARKITYGENITAMGPLYRSMKAEGNRVVLTFDSVGGGLECRGDKLLGFTVCGEDKAFHPAEAKIVGETVVVSCDKVEKPIAVRYGFVNFTELNFWNKDGLPATPFRTDDFPGMTAPKPAAAAAAKAK